MQLSAVISALVLCGATVTTALPAAEATPAVVRDAKPWKNMHVMIRQPDFSYEHSEEIVDEIRARSVAHELLGRDHNRALSARGGSAIVLHRCRQHRCVIISNLNNANVQYWNKPGCNGASTVHHGCGKTTYVGSPGTNSLGVHI